MSEGLHLLGRLVDASNDTFLVEDGAGARYVYKPVAGEQPLWDFPDDTLGRREVAAYELSRHIGLQVVPRTRWGEGPFGPGSLQDFVDGRLTDTVDLLRAEVLTDAWLPVASFVDEHGTPIVLAHRDDERLRRVALFDLLANNADRKGGHLIETPSGDLVGVDHGLTFHEAPKLRTVCWGFASMPFTDDELVPIRACASIAQPLAPGLHEREWLALTTRAQALLSSGSFPAPDERRAAIPWPPI